MMKIQIKSKFRENIQEPVAAEIPPTKEPIRAGNRFKVLIIEEGLGNLKDCFYYTKQALQTSASLFEGKKCFADHPTSVEEQIRPERSTRDILGHFENVRYEEAEDKRGGLFADLVVLTNPNYAWAQTLLSTAVGYATKFPESEFVGLSINASGQAKEVPLEDFMRETEIPASVLPKLQTAKSEGIPSIRVVDSLKDAVSCDMVTEAGAGGKILQMIEQRKHPMSIKTKEAFPPKKPAAGAAPAAKPAAAPAAPAAAAPAPAASAPPAAEEAEDSVVGQKTDAAEPDHADAAQDEDLFAKMIQQYLGDEADPSDPETHDMAKHAYEAHTETGMEPQEAYEAAGNHLKMAMAIGKKMHQKSAAAQPHEADDMEAHEAGDASEMATKGKGLPTAPGMPKASGTSGSGKAQESAAHYKAKLIQALGENAKLKESLKTYELSDYLDKKLQESKKSVQVTKSFREALGTPKSKEQIDHAYKLFMTGAGAGSEDADASFESFMMTEKNSFKPSDAGTAGSFSDCMEND